MYLIQEADDSCGVVQHISENTLVRGGVVNQQMIHVVPYNTFNLFICVYIFMCVYIYIFVCVCVCVCVCVYYIYVYI